MYALVVSIRLKPAGRERFLAAIEDDALCSERDEPGCLRFNVLQDESDPNRIYLYEVYRDQAALDAHRKTPHYARFAAIAAETVEGKNEVRFARPLFPREAAYWERG
jgi:autoinducer 2-degrading protein